MSSREDYKPGLISVRQVLISSESAWRGFAAARRFREGQETRSGDRKDQPGERGRDNRHDALAGQLFLQAGVRRLRQRRSQRPQLATQRPPPRLRGKLPRLDCPALKIFLESEQF